VEHRSLDRELPVAPPPTTYKHHEHGELVQVAVPMVRL